MDRFNELTIAQERALVPSAKAREAWHMMARISRAERIAMLAIDAALVTLRNEVVDAYGEVLCDNPISAESYRLTRDAIADQIGDMLYDARADLRAVDGGI